MLELISLTHDCIQHHVTDVPPWCLNHRENLVLK